MFTTETYNKKILLTIFLIIIGFLSSSVWARTQKVLVLHSYHQGLEWTDNISAGIKSVLGDRKNDVEIYYDYLDTKRNAGNHYTSKLAELFLAKSHHIPFELIIAADNNALKLLNDHGEELFPDTPVVFCGINNFSPGLISGIKNVTGVVEEADAKATMDLMLKVHPQAKKIMVVLDKTITGLAIRKSIEKVQDQFANRAEIEFLTDFTWDSLQKKLAGLGPEYLVYLLTINRDRNNEFVSYIDGIELVNKASSVPVYGSWDFYLGKGIVGGVITSGFEQGRLAADYALRVLSGELIQDLPIITSVFNKETLDFNLMEKFGIDNKNLSPDAVIINKPLDFTDQIRALPSWLSLSVGSVVIIISLISLLMYQRLAFKNRYMQEINTTLDNKVKEKTLEINASNYKMKLLIDELETANQELEVTNSMLNEMSIRDSVTSIYNRRYISEKLSEEYKLAKENKTALTILMLDIDYFKVINDSFGHQYGDHVLRVISHTVSEAIRDGDVLGRYGGEEFLLILPDTGRAEALDIAESIRSGVEKIDWKRDNFTVTISGGVAEYAGQPELLMLRQADIALYKAKSHGRNRIA
ncbi:diguanylate cyclase [Vibrio sp. JC009]|uniref:ABC transporter substrate binding protein n=1 Tax=Vibrio sp. JC009 TaxID=2912314 RepID=UPI0023AF2FC3|nr:ABC transporter substrate binding protein [Vibrio sp. JC009]WED24065.1 diguanylate cyclase [Vibrio sp. JC009]